MPDRNDSSSLSSKLVVVRVVLPDCSSTHSVAAFFDSATATRDRERIEKARIICPQIRVFYIDVTDSKEAVLQAIEPDTEVLITTRLD